MVDKDLDPGLQLQTSDNNKMPSFTLWFTGLSGSGKSSLSYRVYMELKRRSLKAELLDGDIIRINFSQGLGFSKRDRDINIRRIGFVSYLLNKNDIISIVAAIAPYREVREQNRRLLGKYIEVFCDCPLETLEQRDPKGLYRKARAGEIANFTGVSDPYERPGSPEILLQTGLEKEEESFQKVIAYLESQGHIPAKAECRWCDYTDEDELALRSHLAGLGFAGKVADL
ncbi:MAG: adenylyl-sulfate kinase [Thermodesulfobacteriota bacterium]